MLYKIAFFLLVCFSASGQYFAPTLTSIYQDNELQPGIRTGFDLKYFSVQQEKEYFLALSYAYGGNKYSENELLRTSIGCKTGYKLKYGAMASAIGYRTVNYPEGPQNQYVTSIAFSPLVSYDLNKYFYIETGLTVTAFQTGNFEVGNSYFLNLGWRWW